MKSLEELEKALSLFKKREETKAVLEKLRLSISENNKEKALSLIDELEKVI